MSCAEFYNRHNHIDYSKRDNHLILAINKAEDLESRGYHMRPLKALGRTTLREIDKITSIDSSSLFGRT
jgi:hypothetical protein